MQGAGQQPQQGSFQEELTARLASTEAELIMKSEHIQYLESIMTARDAAVADAERQRT